MGSPPIFPSRGLLPLARAGLLWLAAGSPLTAQDPAPRSAAVEKPTAPPTLPAPGLLEFQKWTPHFEVPDPVAISLDEHGVAYVTQTQRRKIQDLDIREHRDWIPDDLSFTSVADKLAFYHSRLAPSLSPQNQNRIPDLNGDGSHDYRDLTVISELIHRIEDTNGDGLADHISLFAGDFATEVTGIAAGVLHHEGAVYATIAPDLWVLRDSTGDGQANHREVLAHGFGVHIAYAGHDMHGLTIGPDGRLYWTIGDKGVRVTSREGRDSRYPFEGAVLRSELDGSHFEVFARGLRNVQEIDFDAHGNCFGVDNDADMQGEMERFIYIVPHMDAGWRAQWQYRGTQYNPWMDESLSVPWNESQPAYLTPPIRSYVNGPAGFAWNPGTALGPAYYDYFFLTSAPNGQQYAFQAREKGASFEMVHDHQIGTGIPLVGINFGPDGALYGVDWGGGYPLNEKGAVWKIDMPGEASSPARKDTAARLRSSFASLSVDELSSLLGHDDRRVRLKAQFAIAQREDFSTFARLAKDPKTPRLARLHAIWGLGQLTRYRTGADWSPLLHLLQDPDPEVRAQAAKMTGDGFSFSLALSPVEFPNPQGSLEDRSLLTHGLLPLLADSSERVKFHAALALGNLGLPQAVAPLIAMLSQTSPDDPYLRHAGIAGLTGCADTSALTALAHHPSALVRVAAVVALRRREDPALAAFLQDPSPFVAAEAARAIHDDWSVPAALPALAAALETTPHRSQEALLRRAINANFRLGEGSHASRVAATAADHRLPGPLRQEALRALQEWTAPPLLDRVVGWHRPLPPRNPGDIAAACTPHVATLLTDPDPVIQRLTMELAQNLAIPIPRPALEALFHRAGSPADLRAQALRSLSTEAAPDLETLLDAALQDPALVMQLTSLDILARAFPDRALGDLTNILDSSQSPIPLRQKAVTLLPEVQGGQLLADLLHRWGRDPGSLPPALTLELLEAATHPALSRHAPVQEAWSSIREQIQTAAATDPLAEFAVCLEGGDPKAGQRVVQTHLAAQCLACHKFADGKGSTVGPNLKSIGRERDRRYLLESLVLPQTVITPGYGMISLTLQNGESLSGQFRSEKDGVIELRDPEGNTVKIPSAQVASRSPVISTMPPMGLILSKREVRDLVAYLATLRAK